MHLEWEAYNYGFARSSSRRLLSHDQKRQEMKEQMKGNKQYTIESLWECIIFCAKQVVNSEIYLFLVFGSYSIKYLQV